MAHVSYTLTFPRDLTEDQASSIFAALSGIYDPVKRLPKPSARKTIVFEILGTHTGVNYVISFPREYEHTVSRALASAVPGIQFTLIKRLPRVWDEAVELHAADVETSSHSAAIANLLSQFAGLAETEAVLAQWVMTPIGNIIDKEHAGQFWAVGRLAVSAVPGRRTLLRGSLTAAYRSFQAFVAHPIYKPSMARINEQRSPIQAWPCTLDGKTLALVCGLPIGSPNIPGMAFAKGRKLVPAVEVPSEGVQLGTANFPGRQRPIAVQSQSLLSHAWILGPTNSGKSTLLHNMSAQLITEGHGLVLIEPKGDLARDVLGSIPQDRIDDLIWFDPTDTNRPIGLNVLAGPDPERTTGNVVALFKSLYGDSWGPRLEQILRYSVLTAAEAGLTLYDVKQLLVNQDYRTEVLRGSKDHDVRQFWRRLEDGPDNAIDSVVNKLDAFVGFRAIRNIVGQKSGLDMNEVVTKNKILLVPLNGAAIGEANASMLGSLLVDQLWRAVRIRHERKPMFLVVDEWQRFLDLSLNMESLFAEARGHGLGAIVANQTTSQLSSSLLAGVEANARTQIGFAMSPQDAKRLEQSFAPMRATDLHDLEQYEIAAKLMTSNGTAPVVTAFTEKPPRPTGFGHLAKEQSRRYGVPVSEVEAELATRHTVKAERKRPAIGKVRS